MPYTPPAQPFQDNSNPVGGGLGQVLDANFFTDLVAGVDDADARVTAVVKENSPTPQRHGAIGDGVADDTAALAAWAAAGYSGGYIPPGVYRTSATVVQPGGMNVVIDPGATIRATAAVAALWQVGTAGTPARRTSLAGGTLDCANLAQVGLLLHSFERFEVSNLSVLSTAGHGVVVGDPAAAGTPYEAILNQVHVFRPTGGAVPAGSFGLWVRRATDSEFNRMVIVGAETGVRADTGSNRFVQLHPWGQSGQLPHVSFDDRGDRNLWIGCEADSPSQIGFLLGGKYTTIIGGRVFTNTLVPDNVVVGVSSSQASPMFTAIGLHFQGGDSSHRIATDFAGAGGISNSTLLGISQVNVTTVVAAPTTLAGDVRFAAKLNVATTDPSAFTVRDLSNTVTFAVNTSSRRASVNSGSSVNGYSGDFTGNTFTLNAATGAICPGTTAGLGASIYSGSGAPTIAAARGDRYLRTDTPTVANQREYICTVAGAAGAATWVGII